MSRRWKVQSTVHVPICVAPSPRERSLLFGSRKGQNERTSHQTRYFPTYLVLQRHIYHANVDFNVNRILTVKSMSNQVSLLSMSRSQILHTTHAL